MHKQTPFVQNCLISSQVRFFMGMYMYLRAKKCFCTLKLMFYSTRYCRGSCIVLLLTQTLVLFTTIVSQELGTNGNATNSTQECTFRSMVFTTPQCEGTVNKCRRCSHLKVNTLDSQSRSLGLSTGQGRCVVFFWVRWQNAGCILCC